MGTGKPVPNHRSVPASDAHHKRPPGIVDAGSFLGRVCGEIRNRRDPPLAVAAAQLTAHVSVESAQRSAPSAAPP